MSYLSCPEVDAPKRALLVDWLVEVVDEFRLCQECLFLAVSLLDRFLAREAASVRAAHLQLLGVTCLWVAAKYEEVDPPALNVRRSLVCVCVWAWLARAACSSTGCMPCSSSSSVCVCGGGWCCTHTRGPLTCCPTHARTPAHTQIQTYTRRTLWT